MQPSLFVSNLSPGRVLYSPTVFYDAGVPLSGLWVWAFGQCCDKFPLEGDVILGGWLTVGSALWHQRLDLDEMVVGSHAEF